MTEGFLGIAWPAWIRLAAASWVLLFAAVWFDWLFAWPAPDEPSILMATGIAFGCTLLVTALPGTAVLLSREMRQWPMRVPEAAALSSMTLAALLGTVYGAIGALGMGLDGGHLAATVVIGIAAFPLTFGLAFPLGIPLWCAFMVWSVTRKNGVISLRAWKWLTGMSSVGWALVFSVGVTLGTF